MIETNNDGCTVQKFLSKDWDVLVFDTPEAFNLNSATLVSDLGKRRWDAGGPEFVYAGTTSFFVVYEDEKDKASREQDVKDRVRKLATMLEADRIDFMIEPETHRRAQGGAFVLTSLTLLRRKR